MHNWLDSAHANAQWRGFASLQPFFFFPLYALRRSIPFASSTNRAYGTPCAYSAPRCRPPLVQWEPKLGLAECPDKIKLYLAKSAGAAPPPPHGPGPGPVARPPPDPPAAGGSHAKGVLNGPAQLLWSTDEDSVLMQAQSVFGNDWKAIAERVGRSARAVESRWNRISWTLAEDYAVIRAHGVGGAWTASIPGRCPDAVKRRWNAVLSKRPRDKAGGGGGQGGGCGGGSGRTAPSQPSSRQGQRWTLDEDSVLAEAYAKLGAVWEVIAARVSGRSAGAVWGRWTHVLSKQQPAVRGATTRRQWQGTLVDDANTDGGAAARQRPAASETTRPTTTVISTRGARLRVVNQPMAQLAASPGPAGTRATKPAAAPVQREVGCLRQATSAAKATGTATPQGLEVASGKSGSAACQSAYKGVYLNANKWKVGIQHRGSQQYIGVTHNAHEGARWYDEACKVRVPAVCYQ